MFRWRSLSLLGLAAMAAPAAAAGPYLIADLNTARANFEATTAPGATSVELDGFLYFVADDGLHGGEIWRTDGTGEGTELFLDICPGPCSSWPSSLTIFGDLIGFRASDGLHGVELWVSNGTREGTRMPRDLCPGGCSSWADGLTSAGGRLFFVTHRTQGDQLTVTDGTAAGTRIVLSTERNRPLRPIGEIQGRLAFFGPGAGQSAALWWSDGTPEGTTLAVDLCATSLDCSRFWDRPLVVGDRIVFWVGPYEPNPEIWATDGTASGTRKIGKAPVPDPGAALWKGSLYFTTYDSLWQTNGTPEGTRRLRTFTGGNRPPHLLFPFGNVLLFVTGGFGEEGMMLWQTLGTPGSTTPMIEPAPNDKSVRLGPLTRVGNRAYFPVVWATRSEIWETDGTASGTRRRAPLCGGGGQSTPLCLPHDIAPSFPASIQGRYLFGLAEKTYGFELWTLDAAGPRLLRDIHRNAGSSRFRPVPAGVPATPPASTRNVAALGDRLVFSARTTSSGSASLWASDGTAAGTVEIGPDVPSPQDLVQIGDRLWLHGSFSLWPGLEGRGLWTTDGTAAGTVRLAPDEIGFRGLPGGRPGLVLAGAEEWEVGHEPWVSDGTPGGTRLLKDINLQREPSFFPGDGDMPGSSRPVHFTPIGSSVLFAADDGLELGSEPWITDGTAEGTRVLLDINATVTVDETRAGSSPGPFVRFGDRTFFAADDGVSGRELWSTDGTAAGTVRVRDLRPGAASSNPHDLVTVGARLFFLADDGPSDALWIMTSSGQVTRLRILRGGRRASGLLAAGNRLFFVVDSAATGPELWTSDGTRLGTRLVREIRPGVLGSYPQELTAVDGLLLFAADDGVHGLEPWVSDGTAAGTRLLADLAPGVDASAPANFSVAGDLIGFDADDGVHGREMWAVRKVDLPH